MENLRQLDKDKRKLDLREGWKQIDKKDVERIMNKNDMGNYWRFSEDKAWVTTLRNGKITNYKTDEVEVLFIEGIKKISEVKQETKSEVLMDLLLSPENQVKDRVEAYKKARWSNKTKFWFISKGENREVIVLDFSQGKKPKETKYPSDKYRLKMKPPEI